MRDSNKYGEYLQDLYNKELQKKLQQEHRERDTLTEEEEQAFYEAFVQKQAEALAAEQPVVKPSLIVKAYQSYVPLIKEYDEMDEFYGYTKYRDRDADHLNTMSERKARKQVASRSYIKGQASMSGFVKGYGTFTRPREEILLCHVFTEEEMKAYADCYTRMDKSYYNSAQMKEAEIKQAMSQAEAEKDRLIFNTIKNRVDKFVSDLRTYNGTLTDGELIRFYPENAKVLQLIMEGPTLLSKLAKRPGNGIKPEEIRKYDGMIDDLMDKAILFNKRMALMADPYYPYINLEVLLDTDPEKLNDLGENMYDVFSGVGIETYDQAEQPEDIPQEGVPAAGAGEASPRLSKQENILHIVEDILGAQQTVLPSRVADALGISVRELKENMLYCDKNGNTFDPNVKGIENMLSETKGEFYVISRFGDSTQEPFPVVLDKDVNYFKPLIGKAAIEQSIPQTPEKPSVSRFQRFLNIFYKTETMAAYEEDLKFYNEQMQKIKDKQALIRNIPQAVGRLDEANRQKNVEAAGDPKKREKQVENGLIALHSIPVEDETIFSNALAHVIINQAFSQPMGSRLRATTLAMMKVFDADYKDENSVKNFRDRKKFREFAWKLTKDHPELVEQLKSGVSGNTEKARAALSEVTGLFLEHFDNGLSLEDKVSTEYEHRNDNKAEEKSLSPEEKERGNEAYWDSIMTMYGPERKPHFDWMGEYSTKAIYSMDNWLLMQEQQVDLNALQADDLKLDERTFASLNMILSIRDRDEFHRLVNNDKMSSTVPFEDMVLYTTPRDNTGCIVKPIIEPTRKELLDNLAVFGNMQIDKDMKTGKELLGEKLANAFNLYLRSLNSFEFSGRKHGALTEVGERVISFAEKHGMMDILKDNGMTDRDIEKVHIAGAMGRILTEGSDAQADLILETKGEAHFSPEERLKLIDKILLQKAVALDYSINRMKADMTGFKAPERRSGEKLSAYETRLHKAQGDYHNKQLDVPIEFSMLEKNLTGDRLYLDRLAKEIMPDEKRLELAEKSSAEILKTLKDSKLTTELDKRIRKDPRAQDKRYYETAKLKKCLDDIEKNGKYTNLVPLVKGVLKTGDVKLEKTINAIHARDNGLRKLDKFVSSYFKDRNDGDVEKILNEFVRTDHGLMKQLEKSLVHPQNNKQVQQVQQNKPEQGIAMQ